MKRTISTFLALLMVFSAFSVNVTAFAASSTTYDYNVLADGTAELTKYRGNAAVVNIPTEISKSILSFGDKLKVSKVADTCFNNCTSIAEIGIPNGVTMNAKAVNGCTSLRQIYGLDANSPYQVAGGITVKDGVVFKVCAGNNFTKLEIPAFYAIGSYAFSDNTKLETIILHDNCRKIEANAFYNCPNLKNILYDGASMDEFNAIKVGSGNDVFKKAKVTVHYDRAHSYRTLSITKATLTKNGTVYKECDYCRKKVKQTVYYPKTIKLSKTSYVYDGKAKKPGVTVKGADGKTVAAKNYKVTYSKGRKNIGKYTVTVKFKGEYYKGTKKLTFTIKPKATKITKTTTTKNSFTVKYSKVKNCTGYQVQYATDSKFKNGKKTFTLKGTSKKVTKLKAGKTYYVRVRAYKTVNKKKYYSAWTAAKAVKTKTAPQKLKTKQVKLTFSKSYGRNKIDTYFIYPQVLGNSAAAKNINSAFSSRIREWNSFNDELVYDQLYRSNLYSSNYEVLEHETKYTVTENTTKYISFLGAENTLYRIGGHLDDEYYSMTFNSKNGKRVSASDVLGISKSAVNKKVRKAYIKAFEKEYWDVDSSIMEKINEVDFNKNFYLKNGRIYFYSDAGAPLLGGVLDRYIIVSFKY